MQINASKQIADYQIQNWDAKLVTDEPCAEHVLDGAGH